MGLIKDADGGIKVVSMSDVVRHPLFKDLFESELEIPYTRKGKDLIKFVSGVEAMLWTMGLNIFLPYESEVLEHRSELTYEIHNCERFVGSKRKDKEWKKIERQLLLERDFLA